jgi:hypothetical protein
MPVSQTTSRPPEEQRQGLRWSWWNLLLLVPLLMLVTPWFNRIEPRLFGMPFFYWYQFLWVPIGVVCVAIVYVMTRDPAAPRAPGAPADVDDLDEGTADREVGR